MKKYFSIFLAAFALLALFAACQKDSVSVKETDSKTETSVTPEKNPVTIVASIPQEGITKVSLTPQEEVVAGTTTRTVKLEWETSDFITVNGTVFNIDYETLSPDKKSANFHSDYTPESVEGKYTIAYSKAPAGGFANQEQEKDGDYSHLGYSVTLSNVTDYSNITFSSGWAESKSATFSQSSVLWLRALLPDAVAENVEKVIFKASQNVFNGTNTFTVSLKTPGVQGEDNKLDVYATIPSGAVTSGAMDLLVQFQVSANDYDKYTAYRQIPAGSDFGSSQYIGINCSNIESYANASATGIGTSSNPYLIGDQHQMQAITLSSTKQYYRLVDDIDMSGVTWSPWNTASEFNDIVDIDGNGKSISHLNYPLFYVLKASTVKNLTFKNATINITGRGGVLAQFIQGTGTVVTNVDVDNVSVTAEKYTGGLIGRINNGSGDVAATISGCDVTNTNVSSGSGSHAGGVIGTVEYAITVTDCTYSGGAVSSGDGTAGGFTGNLSAGTFTGCSVSGNVTSTGKSYVGGFAGYVYTGTISKCCYKSGTVTGASYLGGLVGRKAGDGTLTIDNSYVSGNVLGTQQRAGGILGDYAAGTCTIENCYVSGSVKCGRCVGGIVGFVLNTGLSLIRCMPYNSEIRATSTDASADYYSSGVVVGYSSSTVIVNYCYRANIANDSWPFSEYAKYSANNTVINHDFIITAGSIPKRIDAWSYSYYHHGRKTSATNLSGLVQMGSAIGGSWSSEIWDFSGDYPTLKN